VFYEFLEHIRGARGVFINASIFFSSSATFASDVASDRRKEECDGFRMNLKQGEGIIVAFFVRFIFWYEK